MTRQKFQCLSATDCACAMPQLNLSGYSYVAPELQTSEPTEFGTINDFGDDSTDENLNSLARHILSNRDPVIFFYFLFDG